MALVLEYVNDDRVYATQQLLHEAAAWSAARRNHYRSVITAMTILLAACYAAFKAEIVVLLVIFAFALIVLVWRSFPYSRIQRRAIEETTKGLPSKRFRLVADEAGLRETVEDIQSFAPWTSIRSYMVFQDVLFIELKARLWAMIPRYGLEASSASLEQLIELLRSRGIVEREKSNVA